MIWGKPSCIDAGMKETMIKTNNMAQQTAVEWLIEQIESCKITMYNDRDRKKLISLTNENLIEQAKQMEKEQMVEFAEFVAFYPDKNKNYEGEMLHAKSKYDEAERTINLLEQYYNETYSK